MKPHPEYCIFPYINALTDSLFYVGGLSVVMGSQCDALGQLGLLVNVPLYFIAKYHIVEKFGDFTDSCECLARKSLVSNTIICGYLPVNGCLARTYCSCLT